MNLSLHSRPALQLSGLLMLGLAGQNTFAQGADGGAPAPAGKPGIKFAQTVFDFQRVIGGESVRHDFYFTNVGTAPLRITSVNATCGCTTAGEWTREVAPGATGVIPLKFNSGNFSGAVTKTATVGCNDPASASVTLQIKGTVWRPIEVAPTLAMLNVNSELVSNATATVRITNHATQPLEVFEPVSNNPQFSAEIRTNAPGKLYEVVIHTVPPLNITNPHGLINLRTSSTNNPTIGISAMCVVQPSIMINPPRLVVTEAQRQGEFTAVVNLRNGMNRPLKLTDATVNVAGAKVTLREVEPNRSFEAKVVLPPGAEVGNAAAELSVKSNFADYDVVHVPILFVNGTNAFTAQGLPMTARASRYLSSPEGRRAQEASADDYLKDDDKDAATDIDIPVTPPPKRK